MGGRDVAPSAEGRATEVSIRGSGRAIAIAWGWTMDGSVNLGADVRREIEDLIADYAHAIDDDRLEEWPDFSPTTARIASSTGKITPRAGGSASWTAQARACCGTVFSPEANVYEPHFYRHLQSGIRITGMDGDAYVVETSFAIVRTMQEGDMSIFVPESSSTRSFSMAIRRFSGKDWLSRLKSHSYPDRHTHLRFAQVTSSPVSPLRSATQRHRPRDCDQGIAEPRCV